MVIFYVYLLSIQFINLLSNRQIFKIVTLTLQVNLRNKTMDDINNVHSKSRKTKKTFFRLKIMDVKV